jgi:hypothetical protein
MPSLSSILLSVISASSFLYFGSRVVTTALRFFSSSILAISSLDGIVVGACGFSNDGFALESYGSLIIERVDGFIGEVSIFFGKIYDIQAMRLWGLGEYCYNSS